MSANGAWRLPRYAAPVLSRIAILVTLVACGEHDTERMTAIKSTTRIQGLAREMIDCVARLQQAERPSTDPDDEGIEPATEPSPSAAPGNAPPAIAPPSR